LPNAKSVSRLRHFWALSLQAAEIRLGEFNLIRPATNPISQEAA